MDDPEGWYPRISNDWTVADKPLLGRMQPDGTVPCSWLMFAQGDFVDVAVSFDVCFRGQRGVNINLKMMQVVQVVPQGTDVGAGCSCPRL